MKSLYVFAVAGAIFALCSIGVEARGGGQGGPQENRPNRPPRPSRDCTSDDQCNRGDRDGVCYNSLCFFSCASSDECTDRQGRQRGVCDTDNSRWGKGGRKGGVCDTDNSRCVMC